MGNKVFYPEEVKKEVVRLKLEGKYSNQELMEMFGIKNRSQIKTWVKWFKNGETHRLAQPLGKQYSYGKGPDDESELAELRKKVAYYEMREELLGKVSGNRKEVVPEVFVKIVEMFKHKYTVIALCECFGVAKATYYRWRGKAWGPSELEKKIIDICEDLKFRIGHRMVRDILDKEHKLKINRNTVQRVMQKFNIQCRVKPKRQNYIAGESKIVVPNYLNRNFYASKPNEKWVTDITYLPYGEKMLYLSTIMDLYNNEILAYTISDKQDKALVLDTLKRACEGRDVFECILHSDQGSQYTSYDFQEDAKKRGIITSMSRRGNCFDNAVIESFHSSLKSEEFSPLDRGKLTTHTVRKKIESYMYYYNYCRPFTKLNCQTPIEFRVMAA
ncbi:IS3 family transposase [Rossellomorea vietnamensis]|uniref:IS3 family transposase n=1 Tax=Rossellomorea vietnamensis TaxID=218284 RepID=UPI001E2F1F61|nr:IS3 family transposase [Rossellomorea vietnamensis]MCC5802956.1 IS3 family transposase [Rossellomorea vietnamensis]